ncbi:uncharacterized protein LOC124913851 [Impatiens glandulifera]|uniref:uncharacterized protein LOC124913851 n=1 Tax=Impatiens glandulifera TaxID=253017 RepID=UPI001FB0526C|nr:uncharacterized protein LOC124913851 [Impatiens glandulifera]
MRSMMMLPLKLVRSLVLGENLKIKNSQEHDIIFSDDDDEDDDRNNFHGRTTRIRNKNGEPKSGKTPLLLFMPTNELVTDTYRLASLARDIGMDLYPNPSLSHLIFSWPSSTSSSNDPSICSSSYSSWFWSLPNDAIPLPFPSLSFSSISNLRCFVGLSKGFFKLGFSKYTLNAKSNPSERIGLRISNWDCRSVSLIFRGTGNRVVTMEGFCLALAGSGWSMYKSMINSNNNNNDSGKKSVIYMFRKMDMNRVRVMQSTSGDGDKEERNRVRELKLPSMDFMNAPFRILQYILLMTDDLFYILPD